MENVKQLLDEMLPNTGRIFGTEPTAFAEISELPSGGRTYTFATYIDDKHTQVSFIQYTDESLSVYVNDYESEEQILNIINSKSWN